MEKKGKQRRIGFRRMDKEKIEIMGEVSHRWRERYMERVSESSIDKRKKKWTKEREREYRV